MFRSAADGDAFEAAIRSNPDVARTAIVTERPAYPSAFEKMVRRSDEFIYSSFFWRSGAERGRFALFCARPAKRAQNQGESHQCQKNRPRRGAVSP